MNSEKKDLKFKWTKKIYFATAVILATAIVAPITAHAGRIKVDIDTSIEQDRNAGTDLYDSKCYYHNVLPLDIKISNGNDAGCLHDEKYSTSISLPEGTEITVNSDTTMKGIYVIWDSLVPAWDLKIGESTYQYGQYGFLHEYIELPEETDSFTIVIPNGQNDVERGNQNMRIADIIAFDTDDVPEWVQVWEPVCDEADMLVFSTHADDEHIFFGGILPIYQVDRNYRIQYAYFTCYWNDPGQHIREHEKLNGLWLAGCKYYPIMGGFDDAYSTTYEGAAETIDENEARLYLTRCIRRTHPQVVVTQDLAGEYGHGQHIFMSYNAVEAITLANDSEYDLDSVSQYGIWDTSKFYIHLYENNQILLDMRTPLAGFNDKRPIDIARQAYLCHQSQQWCDFSVNDYGPYDAALYGLYRTTVGEDVNGNDFMENIVSYDEQAEARRLEEERIAKEEEEKKLAEQKALEEEQKKAEVENEPVTPSPRFTSEEKILIAAVAVISLMCVIAVSYIVFDKKKRKNRKRRRR